MSGEEDLIDYSEDEDVQNNQAPATTTADAGATNGATKTGNLTVSGNGNARGSYVGIHSTSFRDMLLKPELMRAIADCGFEHPSEGNYFSFAQRVVPLLQT